MIYLRDPADPLWLALSRFRSVFSIRDGIYSPLDRAILIGQDVCLVHPDTRYGRLVAEAESFIRGVRITSGNAGDGETKTRESFFAPIDSPRIAEDLDLFLSLNKDNVTHSPGRGTLASGSADDLFVHREAEILPGVSILTDDGPVVIDKGARITPFSVLSGPLYVGAGAMLDHVKIGGSIAGRGARLGGEIEKSIIGDFSNKHHEGFLGHSITGSWVNLGALSTTSDLKNNYGAIRLRVGDQEIETGRIKFGSILGDCVKTAIGTMLNTGTIVDAGSSVFGGRPPAYLPPLSWGLEGRRYLTDRFLKDCEVIFARRKQSVPPSLAALVELAVSLDRPAAGSP